MVISPASVHSSESTPSQSVEQHQSDLLSGIVTSLQQTQISALNTLSVSNMIQSSESEHLLSLGSLNELIQSCKTIWNSASPSEIATQGQTQVIKPGLTTGHLVDDQGKVIYFAREKMNAQRAGLWTEMVEAIKTQGYALKTALMNFNDLEFDAHDNKKAAPSSLQHFFAPYHTTQAINILAKEFNYTKDEVLKLSRHLDQIETGQSVLLPYGFDDETRFVMYISNTPIQDFAFQNYANNINKPAEDLFRLSNIIKHTKNLSMMISSGSSDECSEHRGIFKSPLAVLNQHKVNFASRGLDAGALSMSLHFFGMKCAFDEGLNYMTVSPAHKMEQIFLKATEIDLELGHMARGFEDIDAAGWFEHIRHTDSGEIPVVCDLNAINFQLWS